MGIEDFLQRVEWYNVYGNSHGGCIYPHIAMSPWDDYGFSPAQLCRHMSTLYPCLKGLHVFGTVSPSVFAVTGRSLRPSTVRAIFNSGLERKSLMDLFMKVNAPIIVSVDVSVFNFLRGPDAVSAESLLRQLRRFGVFAVFHGYCGNVEMVKAFTSLARDNYSHE